MNNMAKTLIVDADGLIALINKDDLHATRIVQILHELEDEDTVFLCPVTAIAESITTVQRKLNRPDLAAKISTLVQSNYFKIEIVDEPLLKVAFSLFNPQGSKKNTLFDAVVAAVAKKYEADAILSFDTWYTKQGLRLAVELSY
jgi:predicted nucleic acid-binding protein